MFWVFENGCIVFDVKLVVFGYLGIIKRPSLYNHPLYNDHRYIQSILGIVINNVVYIVSARWSIVKGVPIDNV